MFFSPRYQKLLRCTNKNVRIIDGRLSVKPFEPPAPPPKLSREALFARWQELSAQKAAALARGEGKTHPDAPFMRELADVEAQLAAV